MSTLHSDSILEIMNSDLLNTNSNSFQTKRVNINPALTTPPPKRRRGRPPKIQTYSNVSPAAYSSAAVMKQGTPNAGSPLMRISPLGKSRNLISSSPLQKTINPSPKGGLLMKLNDESIIFNKKKKLNSKSNNKIHKSKSILIKTPKISLNTQHNIDTLSKEPSPTSHVKHSSVNPSLLLSSPITSNSSTKNKPLESKSIKEETNMSPPPIPNTFRSSPMTPASIPSSFSSIIQSSPLYHGYYASLSSPSTSLMNSSPIKYQMKPIELPGLKKYTHELPKNPVNSPDLKPQSKGFKSKKLKNNDHYKISLSIDELGQAKISKVKSFNNVSNIKNLKNLESSSIKSILNSSIQRKSKISKHESLMNIANYPLNSPRSQSLSQDYDMFIEPMKISDDPFFNEINDHSSFIQPSFQNQFNFNDELTNVNDKGIDFEQEEMKYDARKALIKMIRRSV